MRTFPSRSVSEVHLDTFLAVDTSSSSHYGSRGGLAWTPPASGEGSTPTWTEGTPSFTDSSSSGDLGNWHSLWFFCYSPRSIFTSTFFWFYNLVFCSFFMCVYFSISYSVFTYPYLYMYAYSRSLQSTIDNFSPINSSKIDRHKPTVEDAINSLSSGMVNIMKSRVGKL